MSTALATRAQDVLSTLAGGDATLRPDQLRAVELLLERRRVLVVQRTGWGKSAVYFIATRLLRDAGAGPTLLVSPLLALMRDQIEAAGRAGLRAATINSTNREDWDRVAEAVAADEVDLLLISPERLNHPQFRREVMPGIAERVGLLVIDEAHAVSDWGHDFRPDYRRITDVLARLSDDTAVLATTATANDRVVADVMAQLGEDPVTLRGSLDRASLALSVVDLPDAASRLAWLAAWLPETAGSGIVYTLTVAEAERTAAWLAEAGIAAVAYTGQTPPEERLRVEADLKANRVRCVVATSALGMGYDKPDLAFVVHLGAPSSPIAYYQAIGRAGRALPEGVTAHAVLLPGEHDADVWEYFASTAFPPEGDVSAVLHYLSGAPGPVSTAELEQAVNLRRGRLEAMLKILDVEGAVDRVAGGWSATAEQVAAWHYDRQRYARVAAERKAEQEAMVAYARHEGCLMRYLRRFLDDPLVGEAWRCGRCQRCVDGPLVPAQAPAELGAAARDALRRVDEVIDPRKRWPAGLPEEVVAASPLDLPAGGRAGAIPAGLRCAPGRALGFATDPGWYREIERVLATGVVDDEVAQGVVDVLARWDWAERPTWVCPMPSRSRQRVIDDLAGRIGALGRLPVHRAVERIRDTPPQRQLGNSTRQAAAALEAFAVALPPDAPAGPVLLVDDTLSSGWTVTAVGALLRHAGVPAVLPLVLHRRP